MNPKYMTNKKLLLAFSNLSYKLGGNVFFTCDKEDHLQLSDELLRRLNERDQYKSQWESCNSDYRFAVAEADALRKENDKLRGENAELLANQDSFVFMHNNMAADMTTLRKENRELREALSGVADELHTLGNQNYYSDPEFDPAGIASGAESVVRKALAKESEGNHDR